MTAIAPTTARSEQGGPPMVAGSIVSCPDPDCRQLADIVDTWVWPSTSGPIAHARTRCHARHTFTLPTDWISSR